MKVYTINTTLVAFNRNGEEKILDHHTQDFAYKTRETASKALEQLKQIFIADCDYEATTDELMLIKPRSNADGNLYEQRFEIKEIFISEYEESK